MLKIDPSIDKNNFVDVAEHLEKTALMIAQKQWKLIHGLRFQRVIQNFFSPEKNRLIPLGQACNHLLDQVEKTATLFSADESKTQDQKKYYLTCLKTAKTVISILSPSRSDKVKAQLESLQQRVAALQYRIEAVNGGLDRTPVDPQLVDRLCEMAMKWKTNHALIKNNALSAREVKKLQESSTYPQFAEVMLGSPSLQDTFFSWVLRDNNGVSQFVEYPGTCARIKSAYLACRIGRLGGTMFPIKKIETNGGEVQEKVVCLPFYINNKIEYISILNESKKVVLKGGWEMTIGRALNIFAKKNKEIGDLEFFGSTGITVWNCHELGSWNPFTHSYDRIDLAKDKWWKQLDVLEEISKEELERRSGEVLNSDEWIAFAKSTRSTEDMDLDGRHGYLEVAVPTDKGTYAIYPFGNFAVVFPNSLWEFVLFIANTLRGTVSYPDENFFYSHRQQASSPLRLSADQGLFLMKILQKELIKARFGHMIFQFGGENCAFWVQNVLNKLDKKIHNFFRLDFIESTPLNPVLGKVFDLFRIVPCFLRPCAIKTVDTLLGSFRGIEVFENQKRVYKTHRDSHVRNDFVIYQPGYLHKQIETGDIKGSISTGCC